METELGWVSDEQVTFVSSGNSHLPLLVQDIGYVRHIILNSPNSGNYFTVFVMRDIAEAIQKANMDFRIKFIVLYGVGKHFSKGFQGFDTPEQFLNDRLWIQQNARKLSKDTVYGYTNTLIGSKKPLFMIVQGKTNDIGLCQLPLFDKVFAVKETTFQLKNQILKQTPILCSSYKFSQFFGPAMTEEIMISHNSIKVEEMGKTGISVSGSFKEAYERMAGYLSMLNEMDYNSLIECRRLMKFSEQERLKQVNQMECQNLVERLICRSYQREKPVTLRPRL